jgi:hypothetical protein
LIMHGVCLVYACLVGFKSSRIVGR